MHVNLYSYDLAFKLTMYIAHQNISMRKYMFDMHRSGEADYSIIINVCCGMLVVVLVDLWPCAINENTLKHAQSLEVRAILFVLKFHTFGVHNRNIP